MLNPVFKKAKFEVFCNNFQLAVADPVRKKTHIVYAKLLAIFKALNLAEKLQRNAIIATNSKASVQLLTRFGFYLNSSFLFLIIKQNILNKKEHRKILFV